MKSENKNQIPAEENPTPKKKTRTLWIAGAVITLLLLTGIGLAASGVFSPKDNAPVQNGTNSGTDSGTDSPAEGANSWSGVPLTENVYLDIDALEFTKRLGNGINLGNTMEAYGRSSLGTGAAVRSYETFWGQPVTTKEMIAGMKEAGFDTLRIPIAWTNAMNFESGDYTIREEYLDRVEEIICYALESDMHVIINDHWDGSWWGMFGSANPATREKAMDLYISMWTQIANHYNKYGDRLVFESANEELGNRLNDKDIAADSGSLSMDECYKTANLINQTFVDTVRSTDGNNKTRFLLIAGYDTDITNTCDARFQMPVDIADNTQNKLLVSVHFYTPWGYCGNTSLSKWGTKKHYEEQNSLLKKLTKFTEEGYGVIIGEYAVAMYPDGSVKEDTCSFYQNFLDNCDYYNYCPLLWDCNGLYNKASKEIKDAKIAALYLERCFSRQEGASDFSESEHRTNIKKRMDETLQNAPETFDADVMELTDDKAIAWIMLNSGDWNVMYSVGDKYDPASKTDGLIATDVEITGAGTYTVSLDFTGTPTGFANGFAFGALAIGNGETLYPGYVIDIKEVLVNGEPYNLIAKPYTTSDDGKCTRVNLYNEWIPATPTGNVRTADNDKTGASPCVVDNATLSHMETFSITFEYVPGN